MIFCSGMGGQCCKLFRRDRTDENERVVSLREDDRPVTSCPVQCADTDDNSDVEHIREDLIDLQEDVELNTRSSDGFND